MNKQTDNHLAKLHDDAERYEMPGAFGSERDHIFEDLDATYGSGNWQFVWHINGEAWGFDQVFWNVYVAGYANYFAAHPDEAESLAAHFSYAYDLDPIPWQLAYDSHALLNVPGRPNQFHHVALNYAIVSVTGGWRGHVPIQVRGPGTEGERWNPGHIPAPTEFVQPGIADPSAWWKPGSIEDTYQRCKVLYVLHPPQEDAELLE